MPLPKDVRIDRFLTSVLSGMSNEGYIANMVMPAIFPDAETGWIAKMGKDHYRIEFGPRAPGQPAHRIDWGTDKTPFKADEYNLEHPVDDRVRDAYQRPYDAFRDGTMVLGQMQKLRKEYLIAALVTTSANYDSNHVEPAQQDWGGTGDPVASVEAAKAAIIGKCGCMESNLHGVCSFKVFQTLRQNAKIKEYYLNTNPGAATVSALNAPAIATTLGLASLQVGNAVRNAAKTGDAESFSYVWGDDGFSVYYQASATGLMIPNFGYQVFPRVAGLGSTEAVVDRYREENITSTIIRARMLLDQLVVQDQMGYRFESVMGTG